MDSFSYTHDSSLWHLIAKEIGQRAENDLIPLFDSLNRQMTRLDLPVTFGGRRSTAWAVMCQLFVLYDSKAPALNRAGYLKMTIGFKRAFITQGRFPQLAFRRIVANISYPSAPGRTTRESIADTFLANGLSPTDGYTNSSMDARILSTCFSDPDVMSLCDQATAPPAGLWESTTAYYSAHRPDFFQRIYGDLTTLIFR
ncbi:MAG: hypothetical protein E4H15_02820 [Syntrophobacterales bacterium]|nr:MAG: hypothetical protein E4H15_02820 [Syntrophobacterales bacterium]